jgi:antitoxin component HigA of HigAB toxin-antitoxin module
LILSHFIRVVALFSIREVIYMADVDKLKSWMFHNKTTAADLARKVGCTPAVFSFILNGKRPISADMRLRLKKVGVNL